MIKKKKNKIRKEDLTTETHIIHRGMVIGKMEKNQEQKKTKYVMKAHIKLHPEIQEKVDKSTKIFTGIILTLLFISLVYLLWDTLFITHPESTRPTQKEIDKICGDKNMQSYGYTEENDPHNILEENHTTETYIICKTPYPQTNQMIDKPECCYPDNCQEAINNPPKCNCIYLIYCYQKSGQEQIEWYYKITTK